MQAPEVLQAQKPLTHEPEQHSLNVVQVPEVLQAGGVAHVPLVHARPEQHSVLAPQAVPEVLQTDAQVPFTQEPEQHSLYVVQEPEFLQTGTQAPLTQEPEQHSLYEVQGAEFLQACGAQVPLTQEPEQHSVYEVQFPEVLHAGC